MIRKFIFIIFLSCRLYCEQTDNLAEIYYNKGLSNYRNNEIDKARAEWQKSLEFCRSFDKSIKALQMLEEEKYIDDPDNSFNGIVKEFFEKGLYYYRQSDNKSALQEWLQGVKISPDNKQLLSFIKKVENKEQVKEMEKVKSAVKADKIHQPLRPIQKRNEAVKAGNSKKIQHADLKSADKISELYYEGLKYYKQGKLEDAVAVWEQVLKLDPANEKVKKNLKSVKNSMEKEGTK